MTGASNGQINDASAPFSTSSGGVTLETNGIANTVQTILNLINGTNVTLSSDGSGGVTINSSGGSGSISQATFNIIG